jgi:hypothetical protein
MKLLRTAFAALIALGLAAAVLAADPSGSWQWTVATPDSDKIEVSLKLVLKDGKLTGQYKSPFGEALISNVSFKGDDLAFDVEREFNGAKFTIKYAGKLEGDTIKGTLELPGFDGGESTKREWIAKRVK